MSENDVQFICGFLGNKMEALDQKIEVSRKERFEQIESVRTEQRKSSDVLHKRITVCDDRLRLLELEHAQMSKNHCEDKSDIIGAFKFGKRQATGLVALASVVLIGICVLKWGPSLVEVIWK